MLSKHWRVEQAGIELPVVFITMRDAIAYAEENLQGEYLVVKHHFLDGITKRPRRVGQ